MKETNPINKQEIIKDMEKTFVIRQEYIQRHPNIKDILDEFPKLIEFQGEIIQMDFEKRKFTNPNFDPNGLFTTFTNMVPKICSLLQDESLNFTNNGLNQF